MGGLFVILAGLGNGVRSLSGLTPEFVQCFPSALNFFRPFGVEAAPLALESPRWRWKMALLALTRCFDAAWGARRRTPESAIGLRSFYEPLAGHELGPRVWGRRVKQQKNKNREGSTWISNQQFECHPTVPQPIGVVMCPLALNILPRWR